VSTSRTERVVRELLATARHRRSDPPTGRRDPAMGRCFVRGPPPITAAALLDAGIDAGTFCFRFHRQEPTRPADTNSRGHDISARGLWLPSAFSLTRSQVEQVARVIRDTVRTV